MENKDIYFARALSWSIRSDFGFIRWLVDTRDFQDDAITNSKLRILYRSAVVAYAKTAPTGKIPSLGDVVIELSDMAGEEVANGWASRIEVMEAPSLSMQKEVANALAEIYDRKRVVLTVENWVRGMNSGQTKTPVNKSFSDLAAGIAGMLIGGDSTGRPRDILETARVQRLNEPESTGYSRLDKAIDGGWTQSKFYIWGMPSGHGKTSMCCNFASRRCEMGMPTIVHSLEMPARDLLFRMLCDLAEVSLDVAENPDGRATSAQEIERVKHAEKLLDAYVRVYDTPADTAEMTRRIRRHKAEYAGVVILNQVDHFGIVRHKGGRADEWAGIESMAYSLVSMAQNNNIPLLAYSQVPSEVEKELLQNNIVLYNKDFRGSRGIRNAVDYAFVGSKHTGIIEDTETGAQHYDHAYSNHSVIQLTKNRRTGRQFWGVFRYEPVFYRLTNDRGLGTADDRYG